MDRTERFYRIQRLLRHRRAVPLDEFLAVLEVSRATLIRDLEYLRNRLNVPIVWDRADRGYRLDATATEQELPGCPNASLCCDGYLVRIGFLSPHDVDFQLNVLDYGFMRTCAVAATA